jgi:hypothetical protein
VGGTAIKPTGGEHDSERRPEAGEVQAELEGSSLVSLFAVIGIACAALLLAVLPAAIALRLVALPVEWVGAALAFLGASLFGVKLTATAWAIGGRLLAASPVRPASTAD